MAVFIAAPFDFDKSLSLFILLYFPYNTPVSYPGKTSHTGADTGFSDKLRSGCFRFFHFL